jgi:hypothetical protein
MPQQDTLGEPPVRTQDFRRVTLPDGSIRFFPADMSRDDILAQVKTPDATAASGGAPKTATAPKGRTGPLGMPPDRKTAPIVPSDYQKSAEFTPQPADIEQFKNWTPFGPPPVSGMTTPGNIDLSKRPVVHRKNGQASSLLSMSFGTDKGEVLVPMVSEDGRILSQKEAMAEYQKTGKTLGIFKSVDEANKYADYLHRKQGAFQTWKNGGKYKPTVETWEGQPDKKNPLVSPTGQYRRVTLPDGAIRVFPAEMSRQQIMADFNKSGGSRDYWDRMAQKWIKEHEIPAYYGFAPSHLYDQAKQGVKELVVGTWDIGRDLLSEKPFSDTFDKYVLAPLQDQLDQSALAWKEGRYSEAAGHYIASYLPLLGPAAVQVGEQIGKGDVGGALAKTGSQIAAFELAKTAGARTPAAAKASLRYAMGAGDTATLRAARAAAEGTAEEQAAYAAKQSQFTSEARQKLSSARQTYEERVSDVDFENRTRAQSHAEETARTQSRNAQRLSAAKQAHEERIADIEFENQRAAQEHAESTARVRAANEESRQAVANGVASEKVAERAAGETSVALPKLADDAAAKAGAAYPTIAGSVDRPTIAAVFHGVIDTKLKGAGRVPTSLGRAIDLVTKDEGSAFLDTPEGAKPIGADLTFTDLHGMYSEMGRELYSSNLPGDSASALKAARSGIFEQMQKLAKASKKEAEFAVAQRGWRVMENTFRNTDPVSKGGSPLARALQARDPLTGELRPDYVRDILTNKKAFKIAQEMLGRYAATDLQGTLRLLKEQSDAAKSAPKRVRIKPEPTAPEPRPLPTSAAVSFETLPEPRVPKPEPGTAAVSIGQPPTRPSVTPFDAQKWRDTQLEKTTIQWQQLRPYNFMPWRMPFTIVQQVLARMMSNPRFRAMIAR